MTRILGSLSLLALALAASPPARADVVCSTVAEFNVEMASTSGFATDVTVTYDLTGANPADYFNNKGSLIHLRDTRCATGADAGLKLYGTSDPLNTAHPPGTLKFEYGDSCCGLPTCGEGWADPNPSEVIFVDGTEQCQVTIYLNPTDYGYSITCGGTTYTAVGQNTEDIGVTRVELLRFALPGGGYTWEMPNATATNDQICYTATAGPIQSLTVPVMEDVTASEASPGTVYPDVTDLSVGTNDSEIYLKFQVPAINGRVTQVMLVLRAGNTSQAEGDGADVRVVPDSSWSETTLTWNNRPPASGAMLGRVGPVSPDQWSSVEVTAAVTGVVASTLSLALVPAATDTNSAHFQSKEASTTNAPYLRIQYEVVDGDEDGVPDGPDCDDADPDRYPGAAELCNGVDDDCDGEVDEGCPCVENASRPCGSDVGECRAGLETCTGGAWGSCTGAVEPADEVCGDGLDNDCDGQVDNGCDGPDAGPGADAGDPPKDGIISGCSCSSGGGSAPLGPVAVFVSLLVVIVWSGRRRTRAARRDAGSRS